MAYGPHHSQHCGCAPRLAEALDLIADLVDRSPCVYDHHGHCQTHMSGPCEECPHARAQSLLLRGYLEEGGIA